jgi:hypothetical protein
VNEWDTRLANAIQDDKAAAAAIDDARGAIGDIFENGDLSVLSTRDMLDLERIREEHNVIIERADALLGLMTRFSDRLTLKKLEQL